MNMKNSITITSKGQTTIPATYRRKLGLDSKGGALDIRFDEAKNEIIIAKPRRQNQTLGSVDQS